jgi:hypothetical protein
MILQSYSEKAAIAVGTVGMLVPGVADANLVWVSDRPLTTPPLASGQDYLTTNWDIDGDGVSDAGFYRNRYLARYPSNTTSRVGYRRSELWINNAGFGALSAGFHYHYFGASKVETSQVVGDGDEWFLSGRFGATSVQYSRTAGGNTVSATGAGCAGSSIPGYSDFLNCKPFGPELTEGTNLVGFSFGGSSATHYGWAQITLQAHPYISITVDKWAYNDEAGQPVHVDPVPAPPAAVGALTMLGLGAAGMRTWRKRKAAV